MLAARAAVRRARHPVHLRPRPGPADVRRRRTDCVPGAAPTTSRSTTTRRKLLAEQHRPVARARWRAKVKALIVTRGGEGSDIYVDGRRAAHPGGAGAAAWSIRPAAATPIAPACSTAWRNGMDWETTGAAGRGDGRAEDRARRRAEPRARPRARSRERFFEGLRLPARGERRQRADAGRAAGHGPATTDQQHVDDHDQPRSATGRSRPPAAAMRWNGARNGRSQHRDGGRDRRVRIHPAQDDVACSVSQRTR
ncbi:MAG: hypothetical protein MZW92_34350 [Comamonadaceae bacterium]|nr:hypothetical protein [Comamonadaceae bacterium]